MNHPNPEGEGERHVPARRAESDRIARPAPPPPHDGLTLFLLLDWFRSQFEKLPTIDDLKQIKEEIMASASESIAAYTNTVDAAFDQIQNRLEMAQTSAAAIAADVKFLKDTIDKIQNSPGELSAADTASLNAAQSRATALVAKMTAHSTTLEEIDAATPPPPDLPPVDPVDPPPTA